MARSSQQGEQLKSAEGPTQHRSESVIPSLRRHWGASCSSLSCTCSFRGWGVGQPILFKNDGVLTHHAGAFFCPSHLDDAATSIRRRAQIRASEKKTPHPIDRCLRVGRVGLGGVWFQLEICQQITQAAESAGAGSHLNAATVRLPWSAHACIRVLAHAENGAHAECQSGAARAHPISTSSWNSLWIRSSKRWIPTWDDATDDASRRGSARCGRCE